MSRTIHGLILACALLFVTAPAIAAGPATTSAVVHKASVQVHGAPDFDAPAVATLKRDAKVKVSGQQGLWFQVATAEGVTGYVRVNDVRVQYAGTAAGGNARALFTGKAGKGRVSETAGVRGIDESDLRSAGFDGAQFEKLESYRVTAQAADAEAGSAGWRANKVPYAGEFKPQPAKGGKATQKQKRAGLGLARGLLSAVGVDAGAAGDSALDVAGAAAGKSEAEQQEEEIALGPQIAGRILGAAKLWNDDAAQQRVNRIGRWMASQTSRPDLPWTFGVIDSPEINAFAAPGGYILVTRGLYELLGDDDEVAAVLGHELSHVVQRDHYNVIRKQETSAALKDAAAAQVQTGNIAEGMAKAYVSKHGASVMASSLDREAEYRADEAAEIYLARAGFNPLALYAVLQKMTALGTSSGNLAQLYKTHPPLHERMDRIDRRGYSALERYTKRR